MRRTSRLSSGCYRSRRSSRATAISRHREQLAQEADRRIAARHSHEQVRRDTRRPLDHLDHLHADRSPEHALAGRLGQQPEHRRDPVVVLLLEPASDLLLRAVPGCFLFIGLAHLDDPHPPRQCDSVAHSHGAMRVCGLLTSSAPSCPCAAYSVAFSGDGSREDRAPFVASVGGGHPSVDARRRLARRT